MNRPIITPSQTLVGSLMLFGAYWLVAMVIPAAILRDVFNIFALTISAGVAMVWFTPTMDLVRHKQGEGGRWQLSFGILLVALLVTCHRLYAIGFNAAGRPQWLLDSPMSGFWPYAFSITMALFLVAPGVTREGFRPSSFWAIVLSVGLGGAIAGFLLGMQISTDF